MSEERALVKVPDDWRERQLNPRKFDDEAMRVYLEELAEHGLVQRAAAAAGVTRWTVNRHRKVDKLFKQSEEDAFEVYKEYVRERVREIGVDGLKEPIFGGKYKDKIVGHKVVIAPAVTILEAKRVDDAYREKQQLDVNHKGGVLLVPSSMSVDDWEKKNAPKEVEGEVVDDEVDRLETEDSSSGDTG